MEEIQAAIDVCKNNGGLKRYATNHAAVCNNGANFPNPVLSMKHQTIQNGESVRIPE